MSFVKKRLTCKILVIQWDIFNNCLKADNQYKIVFFILIERLYSNKMHRLLHDSIRTIARPVGAVQYVAYGDSTRGQQRVLLQFF